MKVKLIFRKMLLRNLRSLKKLLGIRTGPNSTVAVYVYPDEETAKNATLARNARMGKTAHRMKSAAMYRGEITLKKF